jgi:hypothetical protein
MVCRFGLPRGPVFVNGAARLSGDVAVLPSQD